ncbi:MAG: hypothetical protein CL623_11000 [Arcobacter sp.]|nr:hypothetical protein [Arcobacter sp.]|tara:strand:- start:977 stop:2629 length:1653 start_codon:yes stop_codon:yes gene_type:complete
MKIDDLSRNQRNIIAILEKVKEGTTSELTKELGLPRRTFLDNINFLIKHGLVKKSGSGKGTFYSRVIINEYIAKEITVFKEGIRFGVLQFGANGFEFTYDKNYKGEKPSDLLENVQSPDLFPEFENLIPEYARRDKLVNEYDTEYLSELLVHLKNTHGAYDFINSYEESKYVSDYSNRPSWYSVKNKILGSNDYPNILYGFNLNVEKEILTAKTKGEHSALSGNQNKVDINIDFENRDIVEVKKDEVALYLLKPYSEDLSSYFEQFKKRDKGYYPHIAINEHLFMSFAKNELGFNVPYTALIEGEKEFHYIVRRYDRYENYKYHQKDFAQYLGIKSTQKYKTTSELLFTKLNEIIYSEDEKFDALRFYFYSSIINHSDLHAKNIGALNIGREKNILAPLYDVISVGVYHGNSDALGLSINSRYLHKKVKFRVEDFYGLADILGINKDKFKIAVKEILITFIEKFPTYIERSKELLKYSSLEINNTRNGYTNFIIKLANFYNQKIVEFMKLDILRDLEIEKYKEKLQEDKLLKYTKQELRKIHENYNIDKD